MTFNSNGSSRLYFRAFVTLSILWIALLVIFNRYPSLDIQASSIFFRDSACVTTTSQSPCGYFALARLGVVQSLRSVLYNLPYFAAGLVIAAIIGSYMSSALRARLPLPRLWMSLISLCISTGILTNLVLKNYSGRPRPVHSDLFGGAMEFKPAGSFEGACQSNCSFLSGEASGAGWLICLVILLPPRIRHWIAPPLFLASVLTVFLRVAVGAHFVSDVLLGWLLSVIVFYGLLAVEAGFRTSLK